MDDLFFSTTDAKGVITDSNEVFERLARYSRDELIGSAHNIIRHPDMPGGVFRAMWDTLEAGEPFVGYVRNLAKGDSSYDVLATVTPLPDGGYLSVRMRPSTDTYATAASVYYEMNDLEHWVCNNEGKNRREAAAIGVGRLQEELDKLGIPDYRHLMNVMLPAEVAAREAQSSIDIAALGSRNEVAQAVVAVYRALDDFMNTQDSLARTVAALRAASAQLDEDTSTTARVAQEMDNLDIDGPEATLLLAPLKVWAGMRSIVAEYIGDLEEMLASLQALSEQSRFFIALARLHALMTALFAADEADRQESIGMLVKVLEAGTEKMRHLVAEHQRVSRRVSVKSGSVVSLLEVPREMIDTWLQSTVTSSLADGAEELIAQARQAIEKSDSSMAQLSELGQAVNEQQTLEFDQLQDAVHYLSGLVAGA
ncbi:MAG: PAS domain-containing protein [Corynebacterium sp.]|uniref:PAS domain-containing protein n=1 Tax=Corynebacterium sp. TaxID=1720 RepID=UPI0026E08661|nr:PAS domain-containing protein [Corynebacterium sp.]MDO5671025.1 PAS domain-containing protein [Corynebacterium sp.]